ncbi:MAG: hypothetical protein JXB20_01260 [Bacilli bacterium]|nr:hypothetical protein [Bacilli bacterium]MBN2696617.1 hypothetical protein [Bacilli bacterium]
MEVEEILLLVLGIVILISIVAYILYKQYNRKIKENIEKKFAEKYPDSVFTWHPLGHHYQLLAETEAHLFVIKVVRFALNHELIITNPTYWCINRSPKEWRRSSKPELVSHVKSFIDFVPESSKKIIKVALIYLGCHNISRYINESDVELVSYRKKVNGVYFVRYSELTGFFQSVG